MHVCFLDPLPRSQNYRKAVEVDVESKLTDVTTARDSLRSKMDESKVWGFRALVIVLNLWIVKMWWGIYKLILFVTISTPLCKFYLCSKQQFSVPHFLLDWCLGRCLRFPKQRHIWKGNWMSLTKWWALSRSWKQQSKCHELNDLIYGDIWQRGNPWNDDAPKVEH